MNHFPNLLNTPVEAENMDSSSRKHKGELYSGKEGNNPTLVSKAMIRQVTYPELNRLKSANDVS